MRYLAIRLGLVTAAFVFGCEDDETAADDNGGPGTTSATAGSGASMSGSGVGGTGSGASTSSSGGMGGSGGGPDLTVCDRWNADRADRSEGSWSGNVNQCTAGDVSAAGRANALKLLNLYRFLAGLPAVTTATQRDQDAQECALMMDANNDLDHTPPMNWNCWTSAGDNAAGSSNISPTPGVAAVDLYMADPGNPTTIGHRRWILSNSLGPVGLGTTDSYSCMWVIGGSGNAGAAYTAYPTPGTFPVEAMTVSFESVDSTGWTIQSDSIDLSGAQVTVTDGGQDMPVTVTQLLGGYGSTDAIRFNPQGWSSQAGHTYEVSVTGVSPAIDYQVMMVACQ